MYIQLTAEFPFIYISYKLIFTIKQTHHKISIFFPMDHYPLLFTAIAFAVAVAVAAVILPGAQADAIVSGIVFCDQCKDGKISLFDYPLNGTKVSLRCPDNNGQLVIKGEDTTNWLGNYAMRFQGTPDMNGCYAQVTGGGGGGTSGGCAAVAGAARSVSLTFRMFDMEIYGVEPLLSEPVQPMSYCPKSVSPGPPPIITPVVPPPPFNTPAIPPPDTHLPPMPSVPFFQASACPYWNWTAPEHECYWNVLSPDLKVAFVFGLEAARKFGTDLTLKEALLGRGDPYKTLLREATTTLLNSYTSIVFPYNPVQVLLEMNSALLGSTRNVLHTGLRFSRANSGNGRVECMFKPCKTIS
ncbi:uncharacterized protein LOC124936353 [Impatiens glandulifera]|uniref:uncharacterized protein LOC124936353 n=1 Tax=Impatiens glandulifera TaxID=253017 RepID=UPI001FB1A09C|nr:uncharacterized protein LOC124936353 [Impatiens glandulifera]